MILRQLNILSQQRLDIPDFRALESSACADFDLLAGNILAGTNSYVVQGLTVGDDGIGGAADALVLTVASAAVIHPQGSESGSIFSVPSTTAAETLAPTNAKVVGSFTASATNYVGLDIIRRTDATTSDLVKFLDADTHLEAGKIVPRARNLEYRIYISTSPFSVTRNLLPIAKVTTDANNLVTEIFDARPMYFGLGSGGDNPSANSKFAWESRVDGFVSTTSVGVDPFSVGDKLLANAKDFNDALMTRLWELGGGEAWYSATSDRDVKLAYGSPVLVVNGQNFYFWDSGGGAMKLAWRSLSVLMANSTAQVNTVTDGVAGELFPDLNCLYVDLDRENDAAVLVAAVAPLATLGSPTIPGSRFVIAWRNGTMVYTRDAAYEVGREFAAASLVSFGVVRIYNNDNVIWDGIDPTTVEALSSYNFGAAHGVAQLNTVGDYLAAAVLGSDSDFIVGKVTGNLTINGTSVGSPVGGNLTAFTGTGTGTGSGVFGTGGGTSGNGLRGKGGAPNGLGVYGEATGTGNGVEGHAVNPSGYGVYGLGFGAGTGILGRGGVTTGIGIEGVGGVGAATGGIGISGTGGSGTGAPGVGGTGLVGTGGAGATTGGDGVKGYGIDIGTGVWGRGGGTSGSIGVYGSIIAAAGYGVKGRGYGGAVNGAGVYGVGDDAATPGVKGLGFGTGYGINGLGGSTNGSYGVYGTSSATNGGGLYGAGTGTGYGVYGIGDAGAAAGGYGVYGIGGQDAHGVKGVGDGNGNGVYGQGGATGGVGVEGLGVTDAAGVKGTAAGVGAGVYGIAGDGAGSCGVYGDGSAQDKHGAIFKGKITAPVKAVMHLIGQSADPTSPEAGDIYYNYVTGKFRGYNGVTGPAWNDLN